MQNKASPDKKAISQPGNDQVTDYQKVKMPLPRTFEGKKYYGTSDVAQILGVSRKTVWQWHTTTLNGCPLFTADVLAHDKTFLYEVERVMQLASVYRPNWTRGSYEPAPIDEKQSHINETVKFFNILFGKITAPHFAYLWTKQRGIFSFQINDATQREDMARKAIELSNNGVNVWHSVNPVGIEPTNSKRGDETAISYQTAIVVDIDIRSVAHKSDPAKLAADFDEAKSFLPFTPSLLIYSGYGLHAYYIFNMPITITDDNREEIKRRNNLLLDVVRARANGITIDGVGDLPRIMRTPGTFNYKLGTNNAPICHIVEDSGLLFSPNQIDEKLNSYQIAKTTRAKELQMTFANGELQNENYNFVDDKDFNIFRIRRMLDFINPANLTYDEWLAVGMALKNIGMECSDWENWSRHDERFKDGECQYKWNGFNRDGYDIGTMYHFAEPNGYDAQDTFREWKTLQNAARDVKINSARKRLATDGISHSQYITPERSCFSMNDSNNNKGSPNLQELMTTREVADFLNVSRKTVENWRSRKLFGCYFFPADEKHGDTLYYKRERVEQLKSVYQPGILQDMYKLAKRNPEPTPPDDFQKPPSSGDINDWGEKLSFRHAGFFKADEVADIFGVDIRTVERWAKSGKLKEDMLGHNGDLYFAIDNVLDFTPPKARDSQIDSLKIELQSTKKALADFNFEKISALERLKNIETFDSKTVFSADVVTAAAFAKLFDKQAFSDFRREVKLYGDKHPTEKASVHDWNANVKDTADTLKRRQTDLLTRHNDILAQIHSLTFIADHDDLKNFAIPSGYSVSNNGIEKVAGENLITVCRRPVVIKAKNFSVDDKIFKLKLAYMTQDGRLETLPPTEAAIIFNRNKLVDLANNGLPVTSSNANLLVDYLDAFNAQNEKIFPLIYTVPRCGWRTFNGRDYFIDPRRPCSITNEDKKISIVVDSRSTFANSLHQKGSLKAWRKAYQLAKKSPVARIMIAAAIAPILLKILGERNFLLYICAPTRAGKTTALYLAASAIGDDKIIRSFDATKNGLAGAAADISDFAFLIDEKQVADSKLKEQLDILVYALANGIGRTKLNKDSMLRKLQDWRTVAIMTGETQLLPDNVTGGANTRLLSINFPKEILSASTCRLIHDTIKENHGLAFPLVIDKIFQLGFDMLRQAYQELVDLFTAKYPDLLNEYCRYMAVLSLADAILNAILTDADTLPINDAILNSNVIFKLIPTNAEISDTAREKNFVLAIIAQNQNRFIGGNVPLDRMQMICGKLNDNDGHTYIAAKFLQDECNRNGFDYHKLVADLVADGFFIPNDTAEKGRKKTRDSVNKKLGKTSTRCYKINTQTLNDGE